MPDELNKLTLSESPGSISRATFAHLRAHFFLWSATAIFPLPSLLASDPATCFDVACVYLGVACAWLSSEMILDPEGRTTSPRTAWLARFLAITIAVESNVALFIVLGVTSGVQSNLSFPLTAFLSSLPALGLVPFLTRRVRNRYPALIAAALILLACKLTGCIIARIAYGPRFRELGYVDADWRNAKLMISIFWALSSVISLALFAFDALSANPRRSQPALSTAIKGAN